MSFCFALGLLVVVFGIIMVPSMVFHASVQPLFMVSWSVAIVVLSMKGFTFDELQAKSAEYVKKAVGPILIMMAAGAMIGTMNLCGTLPYITMLGMKVMNPGILIPITYLISFITAYFTGTVFGAIGTVGVIFLSISRGMGADDVYAVSAIFAGGFLGYTLSPLSELSPLLSSVMDIKQEQVLKEFNRLLIIPSALCVVIFWLINQRMMTTGFTASVSMEPMDIMDGWRSGVILMLPMVILLIVMLMRKPTVVALMSGAVTAGIIAVSYQGRGFAEAINAAWNGPVPPEGMYTYLFTRGGMLSMAGTILLFIGSFGLFGLLDAGGIINTVFGKVSGMMRNRVVRQLGIVVIGFLMTVFCASATCALLFTTSFFIPLFEENKWNKNDLIMSSILGTLIFSPFVPWHSNCVTPAAMLGIDAAARLPLMFYPWIGLGWYIIIVLISVFEKK